MSDHIRVQQWSISAVINRVSYILGKWWAWWLSMTCKRQTEVILRSIFNSHHAREFAVHYLMPIHWQIESLHSQLDIWQRHFYALSLLLSFLVSLDHSFDSLEEYYFLEKLRNSTTKLLIRQLSVINGRWLASPFVGEVTVGRGSTSKPPPLNIL